MSLESLLLSHGFCREIEEEISQEIPDEIMQLVMNFISKFIIFGIGKNEHGQLSLGPTIEAKNAKKWTRLNELEDIILSPDNLFINYESISVVSSNRELYVSGKNTNWKLGIDSIPVPSQPWNNFIYNLINPDNSPEKVGIISHGMIADKHMFIYTLDNELYASGINSSAQFGNEKLTKNKDGHYITWEDAVEDYAELFVAIPRFWSDNDQIIDIQCSDTHSIFLTSFGDVYACGDAEDCTSQLMSDVVTESLEDMECIKVPVLVGRNTKQIAVGQHINVLLDISGALIMFGSSNLCSPALHNAESICSWFRNNKVMLKELVCGAHHVMVLDMNGNCYAFGRNSYGQCGTGESGGLVTTPNRLKIENDEEIVEMSCGYDHSLVVTKGNDVYAFGDNAHRQCSACFVDANDKTYYAKISAPFKWNKEEELGMKDVYIQRVIGLTEETIVIVSLHKFIK